MKQQIFDRMWDDVHALFGVSAPKDSRKTLCRCKTEHIPDEAARWITEQFEQMETKPRNMVFAIKQLWQRWQEDNPNRIVRPEHRCPFCIPGSPRSMMVLRRQKDTKTWFEFVVPCGHCQAEGWRVDHPTHGDFWHHCPGGVVPRHLEPLLHVNRTDGEVAFIQGAPFHELVDSMKGAA